MLASNHPPEEGWEGKEQSGGKAQLSQQRCTGQTSLYIHTDILSTTLVFLTSLAGQHAKYDRNKNDSHCKVRNLTQCHHNSSLSLCAE